jgi:hypothetical protein
MYDVSGVRSTYSRLQVIGCHYTDIVSCIVNDNCRDRTRELSKTGLVRKR